MTAALRLPGIKQGANFNIYLDYSVDDVAEVFDASELSAQVRTANRELLSTLVIVADPDAVEGRFLASASVAETANWPVGLVYFDVKRASGGVTSITATVTVPVERRITA